MQTYLTTKQVQELLKVDRITVYRMLQDGRLKGSKIGNQWRFAQSEIERLLNGIPSATLESEDEDTFPTHCIQTIQELFSTVSQFTALVVDQDGELITEVSNPCGFCQMIQSSEDGLAACQASWRSAQNISPEKQQFFTCHAGLNYFGVRIISQNKTQGMFLSGHFYLQEPDREKEQKRFQELARKFGLDKNELLQKAQEIPVLDEDQQHNLTFQPAAAVAAIESILTERSAFLERLQKIAALTQNI